MTEREKQFMDIRLEKWSEDLKDGLIYVCNGTDRRYLTGRIPEPYTEADADWWLNMIKEYDGKDGLYRAIIVDGEVAGNITIEGKKDIYVKDAELGYVLNKEYWGRGIATVATRLIVEEAFMTLDIAKISSEVFAPNVASRRVLEKNGFALEGVLKNAAFKDGRLYDLCRYGKLKG